MSTVKLVSRLVKRSVLFKWFPLRWLRKLVSSRSKSSNILAFSSVLTQQNLFWLFVTVIKRPCEIVFFYFQDNNKGSHKSSKYFLTDQNIFPPRLKFLISWLFDSLHDEYKNWYHLVKNNLTFPLFLQYLPSKTCLDYF